MELALISFDGLDPRILYDNLDKLPNFKELTESSMHGKWKTPGHTIPSFISTLTGEKYTTTNFHWDKKEGGYQRHRQTGYDYLWDVSDSSMTLLNIPVVYPPEDIDGVMVTGFLAPDSVSQSNIARPKEAQDMLNDIDYIHDVNSDETYDLLGGNEMVEYLSTMMDKRVEAANNLIDMYDSDLFYGVWTATDRWFHQCALHGEDYMPIYKKADEVLGDMMDTLPDDVPLICFSDHGFAHFKSDRGGVHKGHMYEGFYAVDSDTVPNCRDDSASIMDLYPTVVNYLDGFVPDGVMGRVIFHSKEENRSVKDRLNDLGYLE